MAAIFEEVCIHDFDESKLSFDTAKHPKPLTLELIDESDKLLIRSKAGEVGKFSIEIFKETSCTEFGKDGFVITDENGQGVLLRFLRQHSYDQEKGNYKETDFHRFTKLVNDFKLGRRESIFTLRTDDSSASQYFQFYGYLSQQQNMMQDYIRTSTYQRAILLNDVDFRGKVVLDVGAGSGILSFFAAQAGARKVYAVEASSMAKHAQKLVESNKLTEVIKVIPGKIEEISIPEQVDVIISEPMGYMLFNERMLETFLHAKKWLAPNGKMFPTQGDLHVAPFSDSQLYNEQVNKSYFWLQRNFHGVDLLALQEAALKEYFYQPVVDTFDIRICMAKSHRYSVNFLKAHENDLHKMEIPLKFTMLESNDIHGLAFWFDVAFFGSTSAIWLSTAPTQPLTHWYQVRCLIDKPLFVKRGQTLSGKVVLVSNKRQSYNVEIELQVDEEPQLRATNSLDLKNPYFRYSGQPTNPPPGWNNTSPSEDIWFQVDSGNRYVCPVVDQQQIDPTTMAFVTGPTNTIAMSATMPLTNGNAVIVNGAGMVSAAGGDNAATGVVINGINEAGLSGVVPANNIFLNAPPQQPLPTAAAAAGSAAPVAVPVGQHVMTNGNGPISLTNGVINGVANAGNFILTSAINNGGTDMQGNSVHYVNGATTTTTQGNMFQFG